MSRVWSVEEADGGSEREGNVESGCDRPRDHSATSTVARNEPAMFLAPKRGNIASRVRLTGNFQPTTPQVQMFAVTRSAGWLEDFGMDLIDDKASLPLIQHDAGLP